MTTHAAVRAAVRLMVGVAVLVVVLALPYAFVGVLGIPEVS